MQWVVATASFFASAVEFVEAFTIVLVVGVTVNWRSSLLGALAAAATLALLVLTLGTALVQWVPLDVLRLVIGVLLLLFGLKWLKNAILRYSGLKHAMMKKQSMRKPRRSFVYAEMSKLLHRVSTSLVFCYPTNRFCSKDSK
jgi:uncharacterized membrane protein